MRHRSALVIGGTLAGLQAALDLADSEVEVHLVESSPFFDGGGGLPPHEWRARQLEILKHPNIHVTTNARLSQIEGQAGDFRVAVIRHPRYVDLTKCTACGDCVEACPVTLPGTNHKAIFLDGQPGCMAIEKAGKAPCAHTCPAGIHVQGYVALIAQGRYREAIDLIREAMPFPSVCGRVCNHYCEAECTRGKVDEPLNIMALKRFVADWEYSQRSSDSHLNHPSSGKRVAIIGAGPAGLTAARDLGRLGHAVTVFDALPVAGGMMRVGIPAHRLPDELLDWEIQRILDEGVELKLNTRVDNLPALFEAGYHAILIATGAHLSRKLNIPNADHPGNWLSLDVLRAASMGEKMDLRGKRVLVLGGGNVALDTARAVLRLGAEAVGMACLEARGEMPGFQWEILVAEEEGIQIHPGRTFKEVVVADGRVSGVRCVAVNFRGFKDGRPDMDEIPDSEHILPADIIIWAIGQAPDLSFLPRDGRVRTNQPAGIFGDAEMMTTMPGVFVAGDVHRGVTFFVVDAIGEGHKAAQGIDRHLRGVDRNIVSTYQPAFQDGSAGRNAVEPCQPKVQYTREEMLLKLSRASPAKRVQIASIPLAKRVHNFHEVDLTLTEEQARAEAGRCLVCGPCSECYACVQVCKAGAISHLQRETELNLNVGAVIYAKKDSDPAGFTRRLIDQSSWANVGPAVEGDFGNLSGRGLPGVHLVAPDDPRSASAVAADVLADLGTRPLFSPAVHLPSRRPSRIGVFLCECGGHISNILDLARMRRKLASLPDVVHVEVLPFSCSPGATAAIRASLSAYQLDGAALAACSCCTLDQACYSCTYQRLRLRRDLGTFARFDEHGLGATRFAFVNVREQCAWVHADQPRRATAKAVALVTAALARLREDTLPLTAAPRLEASVLILGRGAAASVCEDLLQRQGILTQRAPGNPNQIIRSNGFYHADERWQGQALILAPRDAEEADRLLTALGGAGLRLCAAGVETRRPGVFYCDPTLATDLAARAASARASAWLGRITTRVRAAPTIDASLCRACGTCVDLCEFGAPELIGGPPARSARIDPCVCTGCGVCAAHCPTGAIRLSAAPVGDETLAALLAGGTR